MDRTFDEEEKAKIDEVVDLLVAAGYFRARVKNLAVFDKVIGGMCWCLEWCNVDVDVDLFYDEDLTIGQKIGLTEKIVFVLNKMGCPQRVEPHQLQGIDVPTVYSVVQWLVKRAVESRGEMIAFLKKFAIDAFERTRSQVAITAASNEQSTESGHVISNETISQVESTYAPRRYFRKPAHYFAGSKNETDANVDERVAVHSTLLEFGKRITGKAEASGSGAELEKATRNRRTSTQSTASDEEDATLAEQKLDAMFAEMQQGDVRVRQTRVSASLVGSLVSSNADQIRDIAAFYNAKQAELSDVRAGLGRLSETERARMRLTRQLAELDRRIADLQAQLAATPADDSKFDAELEEAEREYEAAKQESDLVEAALNSVDPALLAEIEKLVEQNETAKREEKSTKVECEDEYAAMSNVRDELRKRLELGASNAGDDATDAEKAEAERERGEARAIVARKNKQLAALQRAIDEQASQAELTQYRRRFIELYAQISATHKQAKQFVTVHNALDDARTCMQREASLLNSVCDALQICIAESRSSSAGPKREELVKQLERIVNDVRTTLATADRKRVDAKSRLTERSGRLGGLVETHRTYLLRVREFQAECDRNERLSARAQSSNSAAITANEQFV